MAEVLHRNSLFGGSKGSQSSIMVIAKASEDDVDEAREDQPLLGDRYPRVTDDEHGGDVGSGHQLNMISISVLLLGEFISHADTTLIFVAAPQISSELGSFTDAGWLPIAYTLAVCSTQPLYGRICDIFGRKPVLVAAYLITSAGCVICGCSMTMAQMLAGRVISGLGGAGVMTIASIIITDSVEKQEIARYRSYINTATTLGRSIGGPLGGLITDHMGWPWLFYLRLPVFCTSILLIMISLRVPAKGSEEGLSVREKLARVDWPGALLLSKTIVTVVILISGAGNLSANMVYLMIAVAGISANLFFFRELFVARNPILDLRIMTVRNVALSYLINYLQVFAQVGMMFSVPMYFQVSRRSSAGAAGLRIVPAVVANTIGALLSGFLIQKTHKYKAILFGTGLLGSITYLMLLLRWNGNTGNLETFYIVPAGFATGMAQSAAFVSMTSLLDHPKIAMATGVYFLTSSMGTITGVATTNAILSTLFRSNLERSFRGPDEAKLIDRIISDFSFISSLRGQQYKFVVAAFVGSLKWTYVLGIGAGLVASTLAIFLRQVKL